MEYKGIWIYLELTGMGWNKVDSPFQILTVLPMKTGENNAFYNAMSKDMVALGLPMGRQKHFSRSIAHPGALEIWWRTMEDSVRRSASAALHLC